MPIKRKLSFEAKIALIAVFTSIGALCISAYQAYMQRLQTMMYPFIKTIIITTIVFLSFLLLFSLSITFDMLVTFMP